MFTYNDELNVIKTYYLKFCKEKELNPDSIENVMHFSNHSKVFEYYNEPERCIHDLIHIMKEVI